MLSRWLTFGVESKWYKGLIASEAVDTVRLDVLIKSTSQPPMIDAQEGRETEK